MACRNEIISRALIFTMFPLSVHGDNPPLHTSSEREFTHVSRAAIFSIHDLHQREGNFLIVTELNSDEFFQKALYFYT